MATLKRMNAAGTAWEYIQMTGEEVQMMMSSIGALELSRPSQTLADITYYVRKDGSDTNDGLADTAGGAFLTIQHAIDLIPQVVNHVVTINVAVGTYNEDLVIEGYTGSGSILLYGATLKATAASYVVQSIHIHSSQLDVLSVRGFNFISTTVLPCVFSSARRAAITESIVDGVVANTGIQCNFGFLHLSKCDISNKFMAIVANAGARISVNGCTGINNGEAYRTDSSSIITLGAVVSTIKGINIVASGIFLNSDGTFGGPVRGMQVLTTARTLYVRTDGNDLNDGLTNTVAGAFKTIQAAVNSLPKRLDATATINVAAGTYAESVMIDGFTGSGMLYLLGDTVVSTTRNILSIMVNACSCPIVVTGFYLTTTTEHALRCYRSSDVQVSYCNIITASASYYGVQAAYGASVMIASCVISNRLGAIQSTNQAIVYAVSNSGITNTTVLLAVAGGTICKNANTITGTTTESISSGGTIR